MKKMVRNEDAFIQKFHENMVRKVDSVSDQHNSLMEEFSTSFASFCFWISLILSFFIFIIIYASIVIAFLAINHLMSYVDVYTEAVFILMFKEWRACDVLDKTNQLTGNVYVKIPR